MVVPSPFCTGAPVSVFVMDTAGNGAQSLTAVVVPWMSRASLRKPVPVSPMSRVQSAEVAVVVAPSTFTVAVTRNTCSTGPTPV